MNLGEASDTCVNLAMTGRAQIPVTIMMSFPMEKIPLANHMGHIPNTKKKHLVCVGIVGIRQ